MNICIITGQVVKNATVRGKSENVLVFTVVTQQPNSETDAMISHVPCVIFNPSDELKQLLTTEATGKNIELQGRVNASRFDAGSEPRSNAEVVVYNKSVKLS